MTLPRCSECGGNIKLVAKNGRMCEYKRGWFLPIPNDFKLPTCVDCGEEFSIPECDEPPYEFLEKKYGPKC